MNTEERLEPFRNVRIKNFKYAILIIVIIAAVMSPTADAINLMIWSGPMVLLYFVSICIAFIIEKRRKKKVSA